MNGYRDMTFCRFYRDCIKADTCHRPLTDEVSKQAERWWKGPDAPIMQYISQPECHEKKEVEQ